MRREHDYKSGFEAFLAHTNEKTVLIGQIGADITRFGIKSVLDIGAGNGLMSIPLSQEVKIYTAVEENPLFAQALTVAGINVVGDHFPTENIDGNYDLVLASHSVSLHEDFQPFVAAAWNLVAPDGRLLVITYQGQDDDWTELMRQLGQPVSDANRIAYNKLVMQLSSLGEVKIKKVKTTVQTENIEDMLEALAFVASNGTAEGKADFLKQSEKIEKILKSKYSEGGIYTFPFQHFFLYTHRVTAEKK
jgi:2-polyprenyl-3-methyl-5-hydroxy-6-metoxy-1,4-benzoquinol methylase